MDEEKEHRDIKRRRILRMCGDLYDEVEVDDEGDARIEQLVGLLPRVGEMFRQEGLRFSSEEQLEGVAVAMDVDASGTISKSEFCRFLVQMVEDVQPVLLMELRYDVVHYIKLRMDEFLEA